MMNKTIIVNTIILILLFIPCIQVQAQTQKELEQQKQQAQKQIKLTSKLLDETKQGRKKSYNNLLLINQQIESRNEVIQHLCDEIEILDGRIENNENMIQMLETDLKNLKENYAALVRYAYKTKNSTHRLLFIFSADDFNQAYKRLAYLKEIAKYRRKQATAIVKTKQDIVEQVERLNATREEKTELLAEIETEEEKLKREKEEQNVMLSDLKNRQSELQEKLNAHKKKAAQLQDEIEKLIAAEAKRNAGSGYTLTPEEKLISTEFGNNKGRLPWPVVSGVITSKFGKHAHSVIKNVYINNNGVDIATTKGSSIRSIFDGEVRKVFKVPGYQNAVIIRHGSYLTTYTHLESLYVSEGDKVSSKQSIGTVYHNTDEDETIVHFEIWYGQKKLDPEQWLAK
ncbi:MAG: peptidoglycan DD-metalloendopeptidase family protein [Candidatus Delongbacteria bacterium]|jgi:septal ring factor EnvC (AmiA/AmiB activator)|nr:peptidoglycan DD-metalloendopeptidase family protein [Candidatus Delongbacteria bacterium]